MALAKPEAQAKNKNAGGLGTKPLAKVVLSLRFLQITINLTYKLYMFLTCFFS
jgi:hypothetical protein